MYEKRAGSIKRVAVDIGRGAVLILFLGAWSEWSNEQPTVVIAVVIR